MRARALPTWITHTVACLASGIFSQAAPPRTTTEPTAVPSLESRDYVAPLADAYSRIDPTKDGWTTEALSEAANEQLHLLQSWLMNLESEPLPALSKSFRSTPWVPSQLSTAFSADGLSVRRSSNKAAPKPSIGLREAASKLRQAFTPGSLKLKFKLYRVEAKPNSTQFLTSVRVEASGLAPEFTPKAKKQHVAEWNLTWERKGMQAELTSIILQAFEEVVHAGTSASVMFEDRTKAVLGNNTSFSEQLLYSTDHWRSRISRRFGLDVVANHGLAIGDVNGDLLDDVYLCMQGGLPNRLYLSNADGTLNDVSRESGADWLDYCASALIVDFNNDGHRDLVVGQETRLLFMENDGQGNFELAFGTSTQAQTYSLAAADYDGDGDVDLYACGYNPSTNSIRQGAMGEPMPYHDAQNGGASMLLRNDGNWEFNDATAEAGMDHNNNRFSFAASWEDYDNDGDLDLYVANDYGRNNLYQQTNGRFKDIANELGLEDMSSGMSVAWGDYNRDGNMDLYVSNMFSAAGNRITYQRQFQTQTDDSTRKVFQRHARGNSLFKSIGKGKFQDVSVESDVTMGRWAWGSAFIDINNDSWQDLIVANGFITAKDTGDL
ncbi:VCBS repeat-containing protein [bacterium]|nr:VCBS repeat-containing protein [bacterium]